jgi:hypothetical protein
MRGPATLLSRAAAAVLVLVVVLPRVSGQWTHGWTGLSSTSPTLWSDPDNWNPGVPTSSSFVHIGTGQTVEYDSAATTIRGLWVDAGSVLTIPTSIDVEGCLVLNRATVDGTGTGYVGSVCEPIRSSAAHCWPHGQR